MLIRIEPGSAAPLFDQVADSVRKAIADGEAAPGTQLPTARDVAASLEINVHTVLRAYALLRDEGLIDLRRRRGAVVIAGADDRVRIGELVHELVTEARRKGIGVDELTRTIRERYP